MQSENIINASKSPTTWWRMGTGVGMASQPERIQRVSWPCIADGRTQLTSMRAEATLGRSHARTWHALLASVALGSAEISAVGESPHARTWHALLAPMCIGGFAGNGTRGRPLQTSKEAVQARSQAAVSCKPC